MVIEMVMMIMIMRVSWNDSSERGWREVCKREIGRKKKDKETASSGRDRNIFSWKERQGDINK